MTAIPLRSKQNGQVNKIQNNKPDAAILDATAANRKFWLKKQDKRILWIDIQTDLDIAPDMVLDCTNTGFPNQSFHTIIFDPPHWWGDETGGNFYTCRNEKERSKFIEKYGPGGYSYYGTDVYKTKRELLKFLHKAQLELYRILWDNGVLWFNWSEVKIPLNNVTFSAVLET